MDNVTNPQKLLNDAKERWGSYAEICRRTGLNKSTLRRIRLGLGKGNWHDGTLGKLVKALND